MGSWQEKYGYKGRETSLSGLLQWLYNNHKFNCSSSRQMTEACKIIVMYGEEKIPNFKKRGHLEVAADYIAKKIQKNKKFNDFTDWIKGLNNVLNVQASVATDDDSSNKADHQKAD